MGRKPFLASCISASQVALATPTQSSSPSTSTCPGTPSQAGPDAYAHTAEAVRVAGGPVDIAVAQHVTATEAALPIGSYLAAVDAGGGAGVSVLRRGPGGFEVLSTLSDEAAGGTRVDELLAAQLNEPFSSWVAVILGVLEDEDCLDDGGGAVRAAVQLGRA